ncbi:MAG: DUF2127 domain-containing protein [Pyrinomonadaceae bacterium]|nr:DUF2127 domain-containing protein [Pyrinomonadaceae bacterium]
MHKDYTSAVGIRAIAIFEMVKGFAGFAVGVALLFLLHRDLEVLALEILDFLHVDPAGRFAHAFVENAGRINESNILIFVALAFVYTIVRFVEAYGLWRLRAWAEWFAIISGMIYLPIEIYEIYQKPTVFRFLILLFNAALVAYLIYVRGENRYHQKHPNEPIVEVFKK